MSQWFDRTTGEWIDTEEYLRRRAERAPEVPRSALPCPQIMSDIEPYRSPLGNGWVTSRSARREDLKRGNCREVDPSERLKTTKPLKRAVKYAEKHGLPVPE